MGAPARGRKRGQIDVQGTNFPGTYIVETPFSTGRDAAAHLSAGDEPLPGVKRRRREEQQQKPHPPPLHAPVHEEPEERIRAGRLRDQDGAANVVKRYVCFLDPFRPNYVFVTGAILLSNTNTLREEVSNFGPSPNTGTFFPKSFGCLLMISTFPGTLVIHYSI